MVVGPPRTAACSSSVRISGGEIGCHRIVCPFSCRRTRQSSTLRLSTAKCSKLPLRQAVSIRSRTIRASRGLSLPLVEAIRPRL